MALSMLSQVRQGLVSFINYFCLGLCVLGTLYQLGRSIPLVFGFWGWGYVGLGGI